MFNGPTCSCCSHCFSVPTVEVALNEELSIPVYSELVRIVIVHREREVGNGTCLNLEVLAATQTDIFMMTAMDAINFSVGITTNPSCHAIHDLVNLELCVVRKIYTIQDIAVTALSENILSALIPVVECSNKIINWYISRLIFNRKELTISIVPTNHTINIINTCFAFEGNMELVIRIDACNSSISRNIHTF